MKRKRQIIIGLMLALVVTSGLYASTHLTTTASIGVTVNGDELATSASSAAQPDWDSVLTPVAETEDLRPTAAGDETGIASQEPDTGEHYDKVDEATSDGDTTYVHTNSDAWEEDLYNIADHSTGVATINYVKVYMIARSLTTPTQTSAYTHIKTNGLEDNGTAETVTTSYASYSYQWDDNPQTSASWTWDEIDALQIGVGLRRALGTGAAADRYTRCTQVYAEVGYEAPLLTASTPTGDLFDITPHTDFTGDIAVKVFLVNTGDLVKAYQDLNMNLYLDGSVEAGETPNYRTLTLENGWVIFNLKDYSPGTYTLSVTGGDYTLVSRDTEEWEEGWTVTPEIYCQIVQRSES
jgi:hypothetical protein